MHITQIFYILAISYMIFLSACATSKPKGVFQAGATNKSPDYSDLYYWAAHPDKKDMADVCPEGLRDLQSTSHVDVFYLHPTIYYGKRLYDQWNAPIDLDQLNKDVDQTAIKFQATAFNGVGKVYAPRYRQAHIEAYSMPDTASARQAFELAYQDVKNAFQYYLDHFRNGRPFIIASHSQGTTHSQRLISEFIDNTPLQSDFIVGYLAGIPVSMKQFKNIPPCTSPTQTGCLTSWRTFRAGMDHPRLDSELNQEILITNPISWTQDSNVTPKLLHKGAVFTNFDAKPNAGLMEAQIYKSILWVNKPKFRGSWLLRTKNYHRGDINLFYLDIRENAQMRVESFLKNQ